MLGDFLLKEKITTTEAKAKELKNETERIISLAKKNIVGEKLDLSQIRNLKSKLPKNISTKKILALAQRFSSRQSGFTRVIKLGQRKSDGVRLAIIKVIEE